MDPHARPATPEPTLHLPAAGVTRPRSRTLAFPVPEPGAPTFGPYRLGAVISRSATATVHRAVDTRHGDRTVALKLFAPELSADPHFRVRFRRHAAQLGTLRLPHVMSIHSYGVLDGLVYLDMRLVEGPTLAEARQRLSGPGEAAVVEQLAETISALSAGGLGARPVAADEVLLSGPPGQEFVHVVGLGLGRPGARRPADPAVLVGRAARRARRRLPIAAAVLVLVAAAVALTGLPDGPAPPSAASAPPAPVLPGQVARLDAGGELVAAATAELDGRPVVVGATADGVRAWDMATGRAVGPTIPGEAEAVATTVVDGVPVVVTRSVDRRVHVHRLTDGTELAEPVGAAEPPDELDRFGPAPRELATTALDGRPVVVAVQPRESGAQYPPLGYEVRALPSGDPLGPVVGFADSTQLRLQVAPAGDTAVVLASDGHSAVQVTDARTGLPFGHPIVPGVPVTAATLVARGADPVLVVGGVDNTVRATDLRTGAPVGEVHTGHTGSVSRVSAVTGADRTLVVSTAYDGEQVETRFWDLDGGPVGKPLSEHPIGTHLLAAGELDGRAVLVTGGPGGPAVWDVAVLTGGGAR